MCGTCMQDFYSFTYNMVSQNATLQISKSWTEIQMFHA